MNALEQKIFDVIAKPHLACFATVTEEAHPWVRYVMAQGNEALQMRFATFIDSRKVQQIKLNPEVHMTCGVTDPMNANIYLQIQGTAELVKDEQERHSFWNQSLQNYFAGPEDPKYGIVIVSPRRIEVNTMGQKKPQVWEA